LQKDAHECEAERSGLASFNGCALYDLGLEDDMLMKVGLIGGELSQHLFPHGETQLVRGLGNGR